MLGDTLLAGFSPDEIETVLAHELGHQVNRDIPLGIVFQTAITLVGLYLANLGMQAGVRWLGFNGIADVAAFPVFAAVMGAFGFVTMPLGNAFSRWRTRTCPRQTRNRGWSSCSIRIRLLANESRWPKRWVRPQTHRIRTR